MSTGGLAPINRALNSVPKRAEARQSDQLRETSVDSGVVAALEAVDHQVLYGRRGTGKTHAFRNVQTVVQDRGARDELGERRAHADGGGAGTGGGDRRVVARRLRPVLEVVGRGDAVRIDAAGEVRRGGADRARRSGGDGLLKTPALPTRRSSAPDASSS